jgi:hypothetical protein
LLEFILLGWTELRRQPDSEGKGLLCNKWWIDTPSAWTRRAVGHFLSFQRRFLRVCCSFFEEAAMSIPLGIALLAVGVLLIWLGLPDRHGVHRRFLRFSSAQVIYPPAILVVIALGSAALISHLP